MKTEQDRINKADELLQLCFTSDTAIADAVVILKRQELEAYRAGMLRAAQIVNERGCLLEKNNAKDLIREHYHEKEIIKAANALTLEDLK